MRCSLSSGFCIHTAFHNPHSSRINAEIAMIPPSIYTCSLCGNRTFSMGNAQNDRMPSAKVNTVRDEGQKRVKPQKASRSLEEPKQCIAGQKVPQAFSPGSRTSSQPRPSPMPGGLDFFPTLRHSVMLNQPIC
jgi:hypothetical protein